MILLAQKCAGQNCAGFFRPLKDSDEILLTSSSLGRYVFGSEISYNKAPPRLPGLGC